MEFSCEENFLLILALNTSPYSPLPQEKLTYKERIISFSFENQITSEEHV